MLQTIQYWLTVAPPDAALFVVLILSRDNLFSRNRGVIDPLALLWPIQNSAIDIRNLTK